MSAERLDYSDILQMFDDTPEVYSHGGTQSRARERDVGWRIDSFKQNIISATVLRDTIGSDHWTHHRRHRRLGKRGSRD